MNREESLSLVIIRPTRSAVDARGVLDMHQRVYEAEQGFDDSFVSHVSEPLAGYVGRNDPREILWVAKRDDALVGSVALVRSADGRAQLRWFLVDPSARGSGLGRRLLETAISFAREQGYLGMILHTVDRLKVATRLYEQYGFRLAESVPVRLWGTDLRELTYERDLTGDESKTP